MVATGAIRLNGTRPPWLGPASGDRALRAEMVADGDDRAQMAALLHRFDNAAGANAVFNVGGLSALLGVALLTVGVIRTRVAPAWAAIGVSVAVVLNIVAFSSAAERGDPPRGHRPAPSGP